MRYREYLISLNIKYFFIGFIIGLLLMWMTENEKLCEDKIVYEERIIENEKIIYKNPITYDFKSQSNEDKALYEMIFKEHEPKYGGVIVEMGALDGLLYSISWFFESQMYWKSVLIEANPKNFEKLVKNRPKSVKINAAVCKGENITFIGNGAVGGVNNYMKDGHKNRWIRENDVNVTVPCTDFKSIFETHYITGIDVFILDVEGAEYESLQLMDWSVPVGIWVIELSGGDKDGLVRQLLYDNGYIDTDWDIRDFCVKGGDCSSNECFVKIK